MEDDFYPIFLFGSPLINSLGEISLILRGFSPSFVHRPSIDAIVLHACHTSCIVSSMFTKEWKHTTKNTDSTTALNDSIKVSCSTGLPQEGNSLKYYSRKEFPSDFYEHFPPLYPTRLFSIDHRPPICEINRFRSFVPYSTFSPPLDIVQKWKF